MINWEKHFEGKEHELLEEICQLSKCDNCSLWQHCEGSSLTWEEWVWEECE